MPQTFSQRREWQRWFVVFQRGKHRAWWSSFTSPSWGHCWAFRVYWVEGGPGLLNTPLCLKVEMLQSMLDVDLWMATPDQVAAAYINDPRVTEILILDVYVDHRVSYIPRGFLTCVSAVKAALQLRAWWIATPHQLYRHLLNCGAKSLKGQPDECSETTFYRRAQTGHVEDGRNPGATKETE